MRGRKAKVTLGELAIQWFAALVFSFGFSDSITGFLIGGALRNSINMFVFWCLFFVTLSAGVALTGMGKDTLQYLTGSLEQQESEPEDDPEPYYTLRQLAARWFIVLAFATYLIQFVWFQWISSDGTSIRSNIFDPSEWTSILFIVVALCVVALIPTFLFTKFGRYTYEHDDEITKEVLALVVSMFPGLRAILTPDATLDEGVEVEPSHCTIRISNKTQWEPKTAIGFVEAVLARTERSGKPSTLAIEATPNNIEWSIASENIDQDAIYDLVSAFYPDAQVEEKVFVPPEQYPVYMRHQLITNISVVEWDDYTWVDDVGKTDTIDNLIRNLDSLQEGELLSVNFKMQARYPTQREMSKLLTMSRYERGDRHIQGFKWYHINPVGIFFWLFGNVWSLMRNTWLRFQMVDRFNERVTRKYLNKMQQRLAFGSFALTFQTPNPQRLDFLSTVTRTVVNIPSQSEGAAAESQYFDEKLDNLDEVVGALEWFRNNALSQSQRDNKGFNFTFAFTAQELASVWHLPHLKLPSVKMVFASTAPAEVLTEETDDVIPIGFLPNDGRTISLNPKDRRHHAFVGGKTGAGKSNLMHHLIHHNIANGEGVAVIDPTDNGSLVRDILATSIPHSRLNDVVLLECHDTDFPVPLNPLKTPPGVSADETHSMLVWLFASLYSDNWSSGRMENTLRNILQLLLTDPEAAPLDFYEISNENYRERLINDYSRDPDAAMGTIMFWRNFENNTYRSEQSDQVRPLLNRLSQYAGSKHVERMFCHPNTIDFTSLVQNKKIVLVSMKGRLLRPDVDNLGAIFMMNFYLACSSLGDIPSNDPPRFYLYVDEVHRFTKSPIIADIFAEARRMGLSMTVATQYAGRLKRNIRDGIIENVGSKFSFVGENTEEAKHNAGLFENHVTAEELQSLDVGKAAVRTRWEGKQLAPFIAQIYPPMEPENGLPSTEEIRQTSRENLGLLPVEKVRQHIRARYDSEQYTEPPASEDDGIIIHSQPKDL